MNKQPVKYLQTNSKWKDVSWNGMTCGKAGCGPTSAAMLIATIANKNVTPADTYKWAGDNGHLEKGHGTNYTSYFQKQFAAYGISCYMLNWINTYHNPKHANHDKVVELLKLGNYAIALMKQGQWTSSGHFIVIWWEAGKVYINDPASTKKARTEADIETFRNEVAYYWIVDGTSINEEEIDVTKSEVQAMINSAIDNAVKEQVSNAVNQAITDAFKKLNPSFGDISDVPTYWRDSIDKLVKAGIIDGGTAASVNDHDVNLSSDTIKAVIILMRYIDKLLAKEATEDAGEK